MRPPAAAVPVSSPAPDVKRFTARSTSTAILRARRALGARLSYGGAAALVLAAPFERLHPWITSPWQNLTNLEVVIAAAAVAWLAGAWLVGAWPRWNTPLTLPWIALIGTLLLSALAAPAHTANALRLVGRLSVAFAVVLLIANVVTSGARLLTLTALAMLSGTIVAALAILEYFQVAAVLEWLKGFRPGLTMVGGHLRVTSTLQYPTITSMYLEIVFALALGLLLAMVDRRRVWAAALAFMGLGVIAEGTILTFTRAGVLTMVSSLLVVAVARYRRQGFDSGIRVLCGLGVLIAALLAISLSGENLLLRLTTDAQQDWYRAQYRVPSRLTLTPGALYWIEVTVVNTGRVTWYPDREPPFRLAYHWLDDAADQVIHYEGLRTEFPGAVPPGATVTVSARVQAPPRPGRYRLAWDVVHEDRLWFSTENSPSAYTGVVVSGPPTMSGWLKPTPLPIPNFRIGRLAIWRLAARMIAARPLLGVGPDNFRLLYGQYAGLTRSDPRIHTNNLYLEFLVGGGLIGAAALLWLLWRATGMMREAARQIDDVHRCGFSGIAAALVAVLLHGLVDSFVTFTPTYLMIALIFGLSLACAPSLKDGPDADRL